MSLTDDLKRIVLNPSRGNVQQLSGPNQREAIPASTGTAKDESVGGDGVASPLTEVYSSREYYDTPLEITSSDGLFVIEVQSLRTITMTDDNANNLVFDYIDQNP